MYLIVLAAVVALGLYLPHAVRLDRADAAMIQEAGHDLEA